MDPTPGRATIMQVVDDLTAIGAWLFLLARRDDLPPDAQTWVQEAMVTTDRASGRLGRLLTTDLPR